VLPGLPGANDRVLLVINFQGGNDGLNTVVPYGMADYYRYRPSLGIPQSDVLRIDDVVGLNPVLGPFKKMYDGGKVAIVQGVGYPDPDHSHFARPRSGRRRSPKATSPPAGSGDTSTPPGCRRRTCSTRLRSTTCCPS